MHTIQFGVSVLVSISLSQAQFQKMNNLPRFCFSQTQKVPRISLLYLKNIEFCETNDKFWKYSLSDFYPQDGKSPSNRYFCWRSKSSSRSRMAGSKFSETLLSHMRTLGNDTLCTHIPHPDVHIKLKTYWRTLPFLIVTTRYNLLVPNHQTGVINPSSRDTFWPCSIGLGGIIWPPTPPPSVLRNRPDIAI